MKYTVGELARKTGLTTRTIRFYDENGILTPCGYAENGYRLYNLKSIETLEKILLLKFLGFSIEEIGTLIKSQDETLAASLKKQEEILLEKKNHIERLIQAVQLAGSKAQETADTDSWALLKDIVDMTKNRELIDTQYQTDENLNKRISIHAYSTAKTEWFQWLFEKIQLKAGMKILEIGCGNALFWKNVADRLPSNLEIHLTDYSLGMLEKAKLVADDICRKYPEKNLKFVFQQKDATAFSYPTGGFDRIMANHCLYHFEKTSRSGLYRKIAELLKDDGIFSCTLIGRTHIRELLQLTARYFPEIKFMTGEFDILLETASDELKDFFKVNSVEEHENDLLVPDEEVVFNYVSSFSEEAGETLNAHREMFLQAIRDEMNDNGDMFIHKSTGIVMCTKLEE